MEKAPQLRPFQPRTFSHRALPVRNHVKFAPHALPFQRVLADKRCTRQVRPFVLPLVGHRRVGGRCINPEAHGDTHADVGVHGVSGVSQLRVLRPGGQQKSKEAQSESGQPGCCVALERSARAAAFGDWNNHVHFHLGAFPLGALGWCSFLHSFIRLSPLISIHPGWDAPIASGVGE
jgi:hypothetical protein